MEREGPYLQVVNAHMVLLRLYHGNIGLLLSNKIYFKVMISDLELLGRPVALIKSCSCVHTLTCDILILFFPLFYWRLIFTLILMIYTIKTNILSTFG